MVARQTTSPTDKQRENSGNGKPHAGTANLKPFPPGVSGNPAGRPRRKTLSECLAELLDRTELGVEPLPDGKRVMDLLAEVFVREALRGKFPFAKEIIDRTEGKVPDRIAGHDGGPFLDLTVLSDHELETFSAILAKATPAEAAGDRGMARGPGTTAGLG